MADPRFFSNAGPFSLAKLASLAGGDLHVGSDPGRVFSDVSSLDEAGPEHVSFLDNRRYIASFRASQAGACVVSARHVEQAPAGMALIVSEDKLEEVIAIDEVLERLALIDPKQSRLIELRFFAGLSVEEAAEVMGVSPRTIKREWRSAKAWLHRELSTVKPE